MLKKPELFTVTGISLLAAFVLVTFPVSAGPPPPPAGGGAVATAPGGAPAGAVPAGQPQEQGGSSMLFFMVLMFVVMYFFMIRPQNKKMKEHKKLVSSLERGNEVITSSGILGTITGLTEKFVTLEVAENVRIRMLRSQVSQVITGQAKDAVV